MDSLQEELRALTARLADQARLLADATRHEDTVPSEMTGLRLAQELDHLADATLRTSVERARTAGRTWQEIGDLLGVSRQAAFQRFGRPIDPRTGIPMNDAILPDAADRAVALLAAWIEGHHDRMVDQFDATMTAQLPPDRLAAAWAQVIGTVGAYERMGEPVVRQVGDHTVVDVPLAFEAGAMNGRVSYAKNGQVAGLFVLLPETP